MQYLIVIEGADGEEQMFGAPVAQEEVSLLERVRPHLRPLSDEAYVNGPLAVISTMAKFSYVLDGDDLMWCVEWEPGLLVVVFTPRGEIRWAALRSPIPDFGGREADEAELAAYDEDAHNPQYTLVFTPWDAQFDADEREWGGFTPVNEEAAQRFSAAVAHANSLQVTVPQDDPEAHRRWQDRAIQNVKDWSGEGIRIS